MKENRFITEFPEYLQKNTTISYLNNKDESNIKKINCHFFVIFTI